MQTGLATEPGDGFAFHGNWREFLPIAATNLLFTIVTLGFYRFWATARERRYLWSRTEFLDDRLEWAGTGKEMFIGFLIAIALFLPLVLFLQFGVQALILRGMPGWAALASLAVYAGILFLVGVARFRALRYRLSRTYWRGIRGGSNESGWVFGRSYLWRTWVSLILIGLLVPWAMVTLWRKRWREMSFGSAEFSVGDSAPTQGIFARYLLIPLAFVVGGIVLFGSVFALGAASGGRPPSPSMMLAILPGLLAFYCIVGFASLAYFSAFYRKVIAEMTLGGLSFAFTARAKDWFLLILGHIGLVIVTLGLGYVFIGYRNWSFFIRHMQAHGSFDADALAQSTTPLRSDAEGLADAFDIGAI